MESNDLGSKKMNNKQNTSEELNAENSLNNNNSNDQKLMPEIEIDSHGNKKIVHRARNTDTSSEGENANSSMEISSEKQTKKMVENKDRNSDITPNRYPNSDPDNHKDRGNIKLDDE